MNNSILEIVVKNNVAVVDSRLLAIEISIQHKNLLETIRRYKDRLEKRGVLTFETAKPLKGSSGGRPEIFYWLNERQCILLTTLSRNTEQVVELKDKIEDAFYQAKQINKNSESGNSDLNLLKLEIEKLKLEKENLKLNAELNASNLALSKTEELVIENQKIIKQSFELISVQEEKNIENEYYLKKLFEVIDDHLLLKKVLDFKFRIKSSGYAFSHLTYTVNDLLKLFQIESLETRKIAPIISGFYKVEHNGKPPSEKPETYRYGGLDLIYPISVIACLSGIDWEDLKRYLEIDYKLKFPSSNRPFLKDN